MLYLYSSLNLYHSFPDLLCPLSHYSCPQMTLKLFLIMAPLSLCTSHPCRWPHKHLFHYLPQFHCVKNPTETLKSRRKCVCVCELDCVYALVFSHCPIWLVAAPASLSNAHNEVLCPFTVRLTNKRRKMSPNFCCIWGVRRKKHITEHQT